MTAADQTSTTIGRVLILALIGLGVIAGWAAAAILGQGGRPQPADIGVGLAGSFVGGALGSLLAGDGLALRMSGILGSIIGAVVLLGTLHLLGREPARRQR